MQVLHVGIFKDHCLGGDIIFETGFLENKISHQRFDYRAIATKLGVEAMNRELMKQAGRHDLVFIGKGEIIHSSTLAKLRKAGSIVSIWYGDIRPEPEPWLIENLRECDAFFMSSSGEVLESYFKKGKPGQASFFLNPSNPNLINQYCQIPQSVDPPLFSGTLYEFGSKERQQVYEYLVKRRDIQIIGSPKKTIRNSLLKKIYFHLKPIEYLRGSELYY